MNLDSKDLETGPTFADALAFIKKRHFDYVRECGSYDLSTNTTEFPDGGEYEGELIEIIEGLEALQKNGRAGLSDQSEASTIEAAQITMGLGLVDVTEIRHEGRAGILFRPRETYVPVGADGELQEGEYWPVKGDVVIWIENEGGADVIRQVMARLYPTPISETANDSATHRHVKTGGDYVLLGIERMQSSHWVDATKNGYGEPIMRNVDMADVAIYRSLKDGSLWARPREEFEDGRFQPLSN